MSLQPTPYTISDKQLHIQTEEWLTFLYKARAKVSYFLYRSESDLILGEADRFEHTPFPSSEGT